MSSLAQPSERITDAWEHQLAAYHAAIDHPHGFYLAMDMGTGKSKVACDLISNEGHRRTLIVCPKSVLGVWRREIERHCSLDPDVLVLDRGTTAEKNSRLIARFKNKYPLIVVVNYDTVWRKPLGDTLIREKFDCVICDELHRAKAPGGKASRYLQRLGRTTMRRLGLSGTPMPHSPLDLYGQFRFLAPQVFGTSFARFRACYAICHQQFPSKVLQWINQDDLQRKFYAHAYRCEADVLDLPEATHEHRTCELPPAARRAYTELENDLVTEIQSGTVTVANALVKLLRLQQITSGYLSDGDFREVIHRAKQDLLTDLLTDLPQHEPVVVFCRFRHDLDIVKAVAEELRRSYGELSGRRHDLTDHAEMPAGIDILGCQIQSGGVGIDLTRACYGVYLSLGYSLGDYEQSLARINRPGQTRPVRYYHLLAENTVDQKVYAALRSRKQVIDAVLQHLPETEECPNPF